MNIQRDTEYRFGELVQSPEYSNNQGQITYEYVDLGLPSGTLWAKTNVGAKSETDYGLYFAWGETQGYTANQVPSERNFRWADYKFNPSGDTSTYTKYNTTDGKTVLDAEDDAASVNIGGEWHMPTMDQYNELLNTECVTSEWVENYNSSGINGRLFTSISNGNTLFIPAAGSCSDGYSGAGNSGGVWSSSIVTDGVDSAYFLDFGSRAASVGIDSRCSGYSVRGVIG